MIGTRKAAAAAAGISDDQLTNYAKGRAKPPFSVMAALCAEAGVSLDWLATGEGPKEAPGLAEGAGPHNQVPAGAIDYDLLAGTVQALEEVLAKRGLLLPPDKKGQAVSLLYKLFESERRVDETQLSRIISLVA